MEVLKRRGIRGVVLLGMGALLGLLAGVSLWGGAQSGSSLLLDVEGNANFARPRNAEIASVYVTVQSSAGLMEGLSKSNFQVFAEQLPPEGCRVSLAQLRTGRPAVYRLDIVPGVAGCHWQRGDYVISVSVRSRAQSGAGLALLRIE